MSAIQNIFEAAPIAGQDYSTRFRESIIAFLDADPTHTVEIAWSPGHEGIRGNERADKLAKAATQLRGSNQTTGTHALHLAKTKVIDNWRREWKCTPPSGHYAIADHRPPSLKPPPHFLSLDCRIYGLVTQARTGHAFTGEYYATSVPSNDVRCPCGEAGQALQTRTHIIRDCPRHDRHRHHLESAIPNGHIADILGTPEGIFALANFIKASGAFTKTGEPPPQTPLIEQTLDEALENLDAGEEASGD
ncbi:hypothetical protein K439DRAFT_1337999 [Ramaria rubella]|nr:hypothetical protein K439DRAFT_1337999 [Ramaria rubella]